MLYQTCRTSGLVNVFSPTLGHLQKQGLDPDRASLPSEWHAANPRCKRTIRNTARVHPGTYSVSLHSAVETTRFLDGAAGHQHQIILHLRAAR